MSTLQAKRAVRRLGLALATAVAGATAPAATDGAAAAEDRPGYRVEHRSGGSVALVGYLLDGPAHHATLTAFVPGVLGAVGGEGELVLIDEATGRVVARRRLRPVRRAR